MFNSYVWIRILKFHIIGHLFRNIISYCIETNLVVNEKTASRGGLDNFTQFCFTQFIRQKKKKKMFENQSCNISGQFS